MKEVMKTGDEMDAIWARKILKCFSNHARPKKVKKILHKRRRREWKRELSGPE
jgi:hypothetical protein